MPIPTNCKNRWLILSAKLTCTLNNINAILSLALKIIEATFQPKGTNRNKKLNRKVDSSNAPLKSKNQWHTLKEAKQSKNRISTTATIKMNTMFRLETFLTFQWPSPSEDLTSTSLIHKPSKTKRKDYKYSLWTSHCRPTGSLFRSLQQPSPCRGRRRTAKLPTTSCSGTERSRDTKTNKTRLNNMASNPRPSMSGQPRDRHTNHFQMSLTKAGIPPSLRTTLSDSRK